MRRFVVACCAVVLVSCAKKDDTPAADTTAMAPPAPAPISLADAAGKWSVNVMPQTGDSVLLTYELNATADTTGWTITFPGRRPQSVRVVAVGGDSIVSEMGPYESALRRGVQVSTRSVNRLEGGKLMGRTTATYASNAPDSIVQLRSEGTRMP